MSDFDKEAEREKLRKQFAEDEQQRENTRRMSELLLKGATMTDTHCDTCGDPIFRWEGEEFCPTCSAQQATAAEQGQPREPEPEPEGSEAPVGDAAPDTDLGTSDGASEVEVEPEIPPGDATESSSPAAVSPEPTEEGRPTPEPAAEGSGADLSGTRESLVRTLTRFAREAESTGNPAEARERLAAVEAAAEALAAVRRAER